MPNARRQNLMMNTMFCPCYGYLKAKNRGMKTVIRNFFLKRIQPNLAIRGRPYYSSLPEPIFGKCVSRTASTASKAPCNCAILLISA